MLGVLVRGSWHKRAGWEAQLHIGELKAEDVGHDQDSILRAAVFGVDFVGTNCGMVRVGCSAAECGGIHCRQRS